MAKGPAPKQVSGVYWREDREAWAARFKVDGKLVRKVFGPHPEDRKKAIAWLEDVRALQRKEGAESLPKKATEPVLTLAEKKELAASRESSMLLSELCDDLAAYIKANPTQFKDQRNPPIRLARIKAEIGHLPAASLKPKDVEAWLDGMKNRHVHRVEDKQLSDASVNKYRTVLSSVYRLAIRKEKASSNPVKGTVQRKIDNSVIRWLRPDEERAIRDVLQRRADDAMAIGHEGDAAWERHHRCEFIVSLQTGMRAGEQYGLTWENIDLRSKTIHVPKSKNGMERYIPMLPEVVTAFKTLKALALTRKDRSADLKNESPENTCFALADPKKWWASVLREAKVKNYRWHDNRHSFCSRLVQAGKSLKVVQELAGHKDIKTSARYAHLDQRSKREALEDAFASAA
jgi:integrase